MRRVTLRWKLSSLQGSKEISNILKIVESIEVLSHLSVTSNGVLQLAEIRLKENKTLEDISEISWLEVIEVLETEEEEVELEEEDENQTGSIRKTPPTATTDTVDGDAKGQGSRSSGTVASGAMQSPREQAGENV